MMCREKFKGSPRFQWSIWHGCAPRAKTPNPNPPVLLDGLALQMQVLHLGFATTQHSVCGMAGGWPWRSGFRRAPQNTNCAAHPYSCRLCWQQAGMAPPCRSVHRTPSLDADLAELSGLNSVYFIGRAIQYSG